VNHQFQNILVYGFGLMGGSLALALRKRNIQCTVTGVLRSEASLNEAKSLNMADKFFLEKEFLSANEWNKYDFIIFSLPVDLTCDKIYLIPDDYKGIITDLGSTKKKIIQAVENKFPNEHNYFSSHPMTGSEHSGAKYGSADLYEGKLCILTAPKNVSSDAREKVTEFWKILGSKVVEISSEEHDEILAYLSHSPHIIASLLTIWSSTNERVKKYTKLSPISLTGGGFRDMTRIAGSNPEMWEAIISTNRKSIHRSLKEFQQRLEELIEVFELGESEQIGFWKNYFEKAKIARNQVIKQD
jgi:prephenate dehydrogenase